MKKLIDIAGPNPALSRRQALGMLGAGALGASLAVGPARAESEEKVLTEALVLRDPDIPVLGNPDGDISIVEYFD